MTRKNLVAAGVDIFVALCCGFGLGWVAWRVLGCAASSERTEVRGGRTYDVVEELLQFQVVAEMYFGE